MAIQKIKQSKYKLSVSEQKLCHGIIHSASTSAAAVGAGLAQLPLADNAVITPIQVAMIISLGKVFDQELTKTVAKSLLAGTIANVVGRGISQAVWGWIPGIGNASNAVTAAAITESIGWICVDHFYKEKYITKNIFSAKESATYENSSSKTKIQTEHERESLKERADKFLKKEKSIESDNKEYCQLCDEIMKFLSFVEDDNDELYGYSQRLIDLQKNFKQTE